MHEGNLEINKDLVKPWRPWGASLLAAIIARTTSAWLRPLAPTTTRLLRRLRPDNAATAQTVRLARTNCAEQAGVPSVKLTCSKWFLKRWFEFSFCFYSNSTVIDMLCKFFYLGAQLRSRLRQRLVALHAASTVRCSCLGSIFTYRVFTTSDTTRNDRMICSFIVSIMITWAFGERAVCATRTNNCSVRCVHPS